MVKIRLRALEPSDAQILYDWENDPETWNAGSRQWPVSLADIKALIEHSDLDIWQTRQTRLMIESVDNADTVGCIDIFDFDPLNMHCSLGVLIRPDARRKGFATQAVSEICAFAARTLLAHTVMVSVAADNEPSLALFRAAGFSESGRLRGWVRRGDVFVDEVLLQKSLP